MLTHDGIWNAIDRLAQRHGLSASGLAKKAGLSSTLFNPSKRESPQRKRWPSTESIAVILEATGCTLEEFMALTNEHSTPRLKIPLLGLAEAMNPTSFDATTGKPVLDVWDEMMLPGASDAQTFALEITGKALEPAYHDGDRLILSPAEKPRRGDHVGVGTRFGDVHIRTLGREGAQKIELLSFSPDTTPLTLNKKDILWMHRILWASR